MLKRLADAWLIWIVALGATAFFGAIFVWFYPGYNYDVLMRYAPMADEFAIGNWYYAFHPKYGVFMPAVSGALVWLTGMTGESACRLVATAGWCLAAVPLWHLARKGFARDVAWVAVALLFMLPPFWDYASAGLRDGVRILSYALMGYGLLASAPWLALGLFIQVTLRMDGILVGCAFAFVYVAACLWKRAWWSAILVSVVVLVGLLIDSAMVYAYTGHFLPASTFIGVLGRWL